MANTTTVRFGITTMQANRVASEKLPEVEFYDEKSNHNPEKLVQCPFDKNHQIRACRFPYHLMKCRKNHPKLAKELQTCPYNARHLVPKVELAYHIETCGDRRPLETDAQNGNEQREWCVPMSAWVNPGSEDWEQEADVEPTPFVWGSSNIIQAAKGRNNLPTMRTPKGLPWSDLN